MKFLTYPESLNDATIFVLGFFDGVHQGHIPLFQEAKKFQALHPEYELAVCTFESSPSAFLKKTEPQTLFTFEERCFLFSSLGVDIVYTLPLTQSFLAQSAETFLQHLATSTPKAHLILGEEARFGRDQQAGSLFLHEFFRESQTHSFETIPTVLDAAGEKISSTTLRENLLQGKMKNLSLSLFQPFFLSGKVEHGEKKGRLIGFPTLNVVYPSHKLLPPFGVYRSFTIIENIGYHSLTYLSDFRLDTVSQFPLSETWVSHFQQDIYDTQVRVYFLSYHRAPKKISSLQELKALLEQDKSTLSQKIF